MHRKIREINWPLVLVITWIESTRKMAFGMSAIVTGAASGLGRAAAAKLASRGAGVVIFDLPKSEGDAVAKVEYFKFFLLN